MERFWSKVAIGTEDECWSWLGGKTMDGGYGTFSINYRMWVAHRVAWILTRGQIPDGLSVCHKCDNPGCVNPYHLFLGNNVDNCVDSARKGHKTKKLTEDEVLEIRGRYAAGGVLQQDLAYEFGVSPALIGKIVHRDIWTWI